MMPGMEHLMREDVLQRQRRGFCDVAGPACGDDEPQRSPERVREHVAPRRRSASGTPSVWSVAPFSARRPPVSTDDDAVGHEVLVVTLGG